MYLGRNGLLTDIHLEPVVTNPDFVVDYVLKLYKKSQLGPDYFLVLPESSSEQTKASANFNSHRESAESHEWFPYGWMRG
jgi:hypothetical protein